MCLLLKHSDLSHPGLWCDTSPRRGVYQCLMQDYACRCRTRALIMVPINFWQHSDQIKHRPASRNMLLRGKFWWRFFLSWLRKLNVYAVKCFKSGLESQTVLFLGQGASSGAALCTYMGDFTQPQQEFAAAGENCEFVIAVNVYPVQRTFWIFFCA